MLRRSVRAIVDFPASIIFGIVLFWIAIYLRFKRLGAAPRKPRILWGPTPIGGTHYYSHACRLYGYSSDTLMYGRYFINKAEDFDYYPESLFPILSRYWLLRPISKYLCFLWALPRYEIHFSNFDGGLLVGTWLERYEIHLWHLALGKVVVYPYGGDVQVASGIRSILFKHVLMMDYPDLTSNQKTIERRIHHYSRYADFIFTSVESVDYLPRWDFLLMQMSAIDTSVVNPDAVTGGELKRRYPGKKIIFHAPNHRGCKGTDLLIEACEELKHEGREDFQLVIYERQPNDVILQAIKDSDIVADQFIIGTYALFAIEAMALGKPVLCYLRPDLYELYCYYSWGKECPVVNTPRDRIKDMIVWLLDHPEKREEIGQAGVQFVKGRHSLKSMGKIYDAIIQKIWYGKEELNLVSEFQGLLSSANVVSHGTGERLVMREGGQV